MLLCPETMGKSQQLGTLEEIAKICNLDKMLIPTIDFGHINAFTQGAIKGEEDYDRIINYLIETIGYEKTKLFFVVLIMASPFVFAQSLKIKNSLNINIFENINPILLLTGSLVISVLILTISSIVSVKIFKQADLS